MTKQLCFATFLTSASLLSAVAMAQPAVDPNEQADQADQAASEDTVQTGPTTINKMSSVTATDPKQCTTNRDTPLLTRSVNNTARGDISVHFVAEFFPGCRFLPKLKRNNVTVPGPGDNRSPFAAHDTTGPLSTNGFNWVIKNVPPGVANYQVTCRCASGTGMVQERSMILYFR